MIFKEGKCIRCGCTDKKPCFIHQDGKKKGTCVWLDQFHRHCSACFMPPHWFHAYFKMADGTGPDRVGRHVYFGDSAFGRKAPKSPRPRRRRSP